MSEVCIAQQPIFDRRLRIAGYELLFRDNSADPSAIIAAESERATARVALGSLTKSVWSF